MSDPQKVYVLKWARFMAYDDSRPAVFASLEEAKKRVEDNIDMMFTSERSEDGFSIRLKSDIEVYKRWEERHDELNHHHTWHCQFSHIPFDGLPRAAHLILPVAGTITECEVL